MTLIGPNLDDRSFEQLRAELLERIPVYNPQWTNHNESDPGIALLELFAFLGESLLYRFNQIPDATRTAFLRLLDVPRLPARPARMLVAAETERPDGEQLLAHSELRAGSVSFETDNELFAWPLEVLGAAKMAVASAAADDDRLEAERRCDALLRLQVAAGATVQFYETVLVPPDPLAPGAATVDVATTVDRALWVALLRRDTTDRKRLAGKGVFLGVALDETVDRPFTLDALDAAAAERYRSTGLDEDPPAALWRLWKQPPPADDPDAAFEPVDVAHDTTEGLTRTGVVHLTMPASLAQAAGPPPPSDGGANSPPPLDDPDQAERVIAWLQVTRPRPAAGVSDDPIHRVRWVGVNAVEATQARTAQPELLGTGSGDADQRYPVAHANVLPRTMELQVEEAGTWRTWTEVEDFVGTKDGDRHYRIDRAAGQVRFAPGGQRGRVPQIGERIRVRHYRYGGGSAGNVREGTVQAAGGLKLSNPLPAQDGRDAEAVGEALDRIPTVVHRRERGVTADDFRDLALEVTGVKRADTLALLHPDNPTVPAAGIVSVVVFPAEDTQHPGAPMPDRVLLRNVARHLDQRRLITTELYVIPPEYRPVSVAAGVVVREGYQVDAVRRWVELILRQFLAPLPPYGPDGGGWPLGRAIRRAELEAVAVQVEGVEFLEGLSLAVPDGDGWSERPLVTLERWQVPELAEITVVEGEPLAAGAGYQPAPPSTQPGTILVPLPREIC